MTVEQSILKVNTSGHILAFGVSEEIFMRDYAEDFCEWLDGTVIKMSPVHINHSEIKQYLYLLFDAYFELRPMGKVIDAPFVMRYKFEEDGVMRWRDREPDIQVILDRQSQ
jgi:Uma2 family endonuclease